MGKKSGHLQGDDNGDGLVQLNIQPDSTMFCNGFKVSLHPGDNYRVAAAFEPEMLTRLGNSDKKHKIHLIDTVSNKQYFESGKMASGVLTVWRLLNIEFSSMKGLSGDDNKVRAWVSDFKDGGGKASNAKELIIKEAEYDLMLNDNAPPDIFDLRGLEEHFPTIDQNPPSLDLDSGGNGRFENGKLSVNTMDFKVTGNGKDYVKMKNNGALTGVHLAFKLVPPADSVITGAISEIEKTGLGDSLRYIYYLQTSQSLASVPDSSLFILTDPDSTIRGDTLGPILEIDTLNKTLTIAKFRKFAKLRDDDRTAGDNLLPYDFGTDPAQMRSSLEPIYRQVYLEPIPVYADSFFEFKSHIHTVQSFTNWIYNSSTYRKVELVATGGDPYGIWQCLICAVWQSSFFRERDNDPDSPQEPTNFGLTLDGFSYLPVGSDLNNFVIPGGDITVIPLEQMMDRSGNLNLGMLSIPHELGHQFGLKHPMSSEPGNLMNDTLNTGNASLSNMHRNYIRSRKSSPGIKP